MWGWGRMGEAGRSAAHTVKWENVSCLLTVYRRHVCTNACWGGRGERACFRPPLARRRARVADSVGPALYGKTPACRETRLGGTQTLCRERSRKVGRDHVRAAVGARVNPGSPGRGGELGSRVSPLPKECSPSPCPPPLPAPVWLTTQGATALALCKLLPGSPGDSSR